MYEVSVTYLDKTDMEVLLCSSKPCFNVRGGFVFLSGGQGQGLAVSIGSLLKIKISPPLPDKVPPLKYSIDIHYDTETEDTELLFSPQEVSISIEGEEDEYIPVFLVKKGDNLVRIINSAVLRSVKVNTYTEEKK